MIYPQQEFVQHFPIEMSQQLIVTPHSPNFRSEKLLELCVLGMQRVQEGHHQDWHLQGLAKKSILVKTLEFPVRSCFADVVAH